MHGWCIGVWDKTSTTTSFILIRRPDGNALFRFKRALRVIGGLATLHADGVGLRDVLGNSEQLPHRLPGLACVILIQAGNYHAHSTTRQFVCYVDQVVVKKLSFVDSHNFSVRVDLRENVLGRTAVGRIVTHLRMRD